MGLNEFLDTEETSLETTQSNEIATLVKQIVDLENALAESKKLDEQLKTVKDQLKNAMQKNDLYKWETPNGLKITLVPDKEDIEEEVSVINEEKFEKENRELVNAYKEKRLEYREFKTVLTKGKKGYLRVTLPKGE